MQEQWRENIANFMKHLGKTGQECHGSCGGCILQIHATGFILAVSICFLHFFDARDVKAQASQVQSAVRVAVVLCGIAAGFRSPWTPNPACLGSRGVG